MSFIPVNYCFNPPVTAIDVVKTNEIYPYPEIYSITYDNDDYLNAMQTNQWKRKSTKSIPPPMMVRYEIQPMNELKNQIISITQEELSENLLSNNKQREDEFEYGDLFGNAAYDNGKNKSKEQNHSFSQEEAAKSTGSLCFCCCCPVS